MKQKSGLAQMDVKYKFNNCHVRPLQDQEAAPDGEPGDGAHCTGRGQRLADGRQQADAFQPLSH